MANNSSFADDIAAVDEDNQFIIVSEDESDTGTDALSWEVVSMSDKDEEVSLPDEETIPTLVEVHVFDDHVLNSSIQTEMTALSRDLSRIAEEAALEGYAWDVEKRHVIEDDEEDEQDESELNDELIPWDVSNKLGRERMRKFGARRDFVKTNKAKRMVCMYNSTRPGCLHGKRGLGMKYRC